MKTMLVGDTHGDPSFVANVHKAAREAEIGVIIQLGDFGYNFDPTLIRSIAAWLERDSEHKWYWLDGNHDHHDFIEEVILKDEVGSDTPVDMGGMRFDKVSFPERMFYLPRGSVFTVGEKKVMALGGAYSIDADYRMPYVSWWPQETIRGSDMRNAVVNADRCGPIDVMLTHDAPSSESLEEWLEADGYKVGPESRNNRRNLSRVVDQVRPRELFHGHYHTRYDATYTAPDAWEVEVHGVAANVSFHRGSQFIDSRAKWDHNFITVDW